MKTSKPLAPEIEFVQPAVLAPILGLSPGMVIKLAHQKRLPYVKEGSCYLFPIKIILRDWHDRAQREVGPCR